MKVFRRTTKEFFCFCSIPVFGPNTPTSVVLVLVRAVITI